ncbi:MAG TPA: immunoglobulin domain-containing protein [Verrucomicrobiae bacterium]|nr:immunoglobulin domain-containing protein [Verrucomicrobiae bacterium]
MKSLFFALAILVVCFSSRADSLPAFTTQPTNQNVLQGNTATFSVAATAATSFQWRFNGTDISGATNSTLQVPNVQTNNSGYYMVVAENATGWVPSGLVYLSIGSFSPIYLGGGFVPLSNLSDDYQPGTIYGAPIINGVAQVIAGPQLDQMQPIGESTPVSDGYFDDFDQMVPTVVPGQVVYYRVGITYPAYGGTYTQLSTVLKLIAGGETPDASNLKFPGWPEWPEPNLSYESPGSFVKIPGETFNLTDTFFAYTDFGTPYCQWRKDGNAIAGATNLVQISGGLWGGEYQAVLTISNLQPANAGVYDLMVFGNNWTVSSKKTLNIQVTNGQGVLQSPRVNNTNFLCDLVGIAGRQYALQWSTDLLNWQSLPAASNVTGTITFTNFQAGSAQFYRAMLLP